MNLRSVLPALVLGSALVAVPALAQHQGHAMPPSRPASPPATDPVDPHAGHDTGLPPAPDPHAGHTMPATEVPSPIDPHAGHDMSATPAPDPHAGHAPAVRSGSPAEPMAGMDHSTMDHGAMGNAAPVSPGPDRETSPPPEAGSGPPRAADAIWGAEAMRASRAALQRTHGNLAVFWFQGDRLETQVREGADGYLWDLQGYYGGPTSRFWFKSEGEGEFDERVDEAEVQALYSRAIAPFFDLQAGVRHDLAGPDTTHAVIGVQGVAPYMFELDGALFLSHRGDLTARIEAELDQRITQSLIVQPRAEVTLSAQDMPRLGIGAGIDAIELGVRLRYELKREFAPYIGIEQRWRVGRSADFARAAGEHRSATSLVAGIRFWF